MYRLNLQQQTPEILSDLHTSVSVSKYGYSSQGMRIFQSANTPDLLPGYVIRQPDVVK